MAPDDLGSITVEPMSGKIRLLREPCSGDARPPYIGACNYVHMSPTELMISALSAHGVTRAQLRDIARWAYAAGYRWIYAERLPGHTLPMAVRRTARPLEGWYEVNLAAVMAHLPRADHG